MDEQTDGQNTMLSYFLFGQTYKCVCFFIVSIDPFKLNLKIYIN